MGRPYDAQNEELRISKMISEGGLGVEAYYYYQPFQHEKKLEKEDIAAKAMIDEGGLGAEIYYNNGRMTRIGDNENEWIN